MLGPSGPPSLPEKFRLPFINGPWADPSERPTRPHDSSGLLGLSPRIAGRFNSFRGRHCESSQPGKSAFLLPRRPSQGGCLRSCDVLSHGGRSFLAVLQAKENIPLPLPWTARPLRLTQRSRCTEELLSLTRLSRFPLAPRGVLRRLRCSYPKGCRMHSRIHSGSPCTTHY